MAADGPYHPAVAAAADCPLSIDAPPSAHHFSSPPVVWRRRYRLFANGAVDVADFRRGREGGDVRMISAGLARGSSHAENTMNVIFLQYAVRRCCDKRTVVSYYTIDTNMEQWRMILYHHDELFR